MSAPSPQLQELGRRIERLVVDPTSISAPFTRMFRGLLHRIGWKPKASLTKLQVLVLGLDEVRSGDLPIAECHKRLKAAIDELEDNVSQVERATVVSERALVSQATWLRRLYELTVHAERAVQHGDFAALVAASLPDPTAMLPPLAMGKARPQTEVEAEARAAEARANDGKPMAALPPASQEGAGRAPSPATPRADPTRVLELQLDTIDHLMAAAREENALLDRRRRLLDSARQLLLETSAALELDAEGVQQRLQGIAREITAINRYQAAGVDPRVAVVHQARRALSRGERDKLFATLSVLRRGATASGDVSTTRITTEAMQRLRAQPPTPDLAELSLRRSAEEVLGQSVVEAVRAGHIAGSKTPRRTYVEGNSAADGWVARQVRDYYAPGKERALLTHALTVDGCFEVGGALSPVRIEEHFIMRRVVPFPTPTLSLEPATSPQDLPRAVVSDPRAIVLDLAAGRLLTRQFISEEVSTRKRTLMQGEVRIYLLDGSTSMLGPRARMRDAILVAELATLLQRLENPQANTRVLLYYRYFNHELGPLNRVDTVGGVIEAIKEVTGTPRTGDTNIEGALISSLELIAATKREDPDLARAQIVLITDGIATVDEDLVISMRRDLGELDVGISVIALGLENEALRNLVAQQRARHERAFYHFMPDDHLYQMTSGSIDRDLEIHLPPVPVRGQVPISLERDLAPLVEELAQLQRDRESEALRELDRVDRERRIERADVEAAGEGERARLEALYRDDQALHRRFIRWFPAPFEPDPEDTASTTALSRPSPEEGTLERDDLDSMLVVLATVSEVVESVGSSRLGRKADAVDLLDRLLPNARLSPARYFELLRSYPVELATALRAVHGAVQSGIGFRITHPRDE